MITKYAISSQPEHAIVSLRILVRHNSGDPSYADITPSLLRLYDTEAEGMTALAEFRATYNEVNLVPRSGRVRGKPEDWHLFRVQIHESAEQVD
jgi:hypothetical protein